MLVLFPEPGLHLRGGEDSHFVELSCQRESLQSEGKVRSVTGKQGRQTKLQPFFVFTRAGSCTWRPLLDLLLRFLFLALQY